jgi:hypothetical protein
MARSSVMAVMTFWLARGGVFGLSTSKSVLMRSRAYLPSSRARSPHAEASPVMEARSNRTARYSSVSLASSSRAWASCALMSAPSAVRGEVRLVLHPGAVQFPGRGNLSVAGFRRVRRRLLGRWQARRRIPAQGHSFRCWSCRSSRTSSPRRRGTAGTFLGLRRRRSSTPRTRAKWRAAARWRSRGTTCRWWWRGFS